MTITVTVHNFTGRSFPLDVDPASKISVVKAAITRAMGKQAKLPLEWRGHELRDHQTLSHYGIAIGDVLHIREHYVLGQ
jgi:uncharacterized ubiquitin-like protein YukD